MRRRRRDGSCGSAGGRRGREKGLDTIPPPGYPGGRRKMDGTGPRAQVGACLRKGSGD